MGETVLAEEDSAAAPLVASAASLALLEQQARETAQAEREAQSLVSELGQRLLEAEYAFDRVVAELRFVQGTPAAQVKQDLARELQGTLHLLRQQKDEAVVTFLHAKERALFTRGQHQRAVDEAARLQHDIGLQEGLVMRHERALKDAECAFETAYAALEQSRGQLEGLKRRLGALQGQEP